jgi:hypothetical protein
MLSCGSQSWLQAAFQAAPQFRCSRPVTWGRLQPTPEGTPGFGPTFFGFVCAESAVPKPEKFETPLRKPA